VLTPQIISGGMHPLPLELPWDFGLLTIFPSSSPTSIAFRGTMFLYSPEISEKVLSLSELDTSHPSLLHEVVIEKSGMDVLGAFEREPWALEARDLSGYTPLHWAVLRGDVEAVKTLIGIGANIESTNCGGETPLHIAAQEDDLPCASALLDAGADVNTKCHFGESPLMTALRDARWKMVELLLSRGARPYFWYHRSLFGPYTPDTSDEGLDKIAKKWKCMVDHGADLESPDTDGWTLIHNSVYSDHAHAFRVFHQLGARLDVLTPWGQNILHIAARYATSELFRAMRDAQISGLSIHSLDDDGDSPMGNFEWRLSLTEEELPPGVKKPTEEDIAEFEALMREVQERHDRQARRDEDEQEDGKSGVLGRCVELLASDDDDDEDEWASACEDSGSEMPGKHDQQFESDDKEEEEGKGSESGMSERS